MGVASGRNGPCVFIHTETGLRVAIVVDDTLSRRSERATTAFYGQLGKQFDCKDPPCLSQCHDSPIKLFEYIGLDITMHDTHGTPYISTSQERDLMNHIMETSIGDMKHLDNPMPNMLL